MLNLIKIKDPSLKWEYLEEFKPQTDCFIVSDIKTKLSIESEKLKKNQALPGSSVLRANEFYKEIFYSMDLEWSLCSDFFIKKLFSEFCGRNKKLGIKNLKNSESFFEFFNSFFSVFLHQESTRLFIEWFAEKRFPSLQWEPWFDLGQNFFSYLSVKKIFPESALKAVLFHYLPLTDKICFAKKRIFVDLAFSFDRCEREIFKALSRDKDIYILSPELENHLAYNPTFDVYQGLEGELGERQIVFLDSQFKAQETVREEKDKKAFHLLTQKRSDAFFKGTNRPTKHSSGQFATPPGKPFFKGTNRPTKHPALAQKRSGHFFKVKSKTRLEEIEKALAQVCQWLKVGAAPKDIVLFAPNMEDYWPALKIYFEKEQIPAKKSVFAPLADFPDGQYFLSTLKIHLSYFKFEDLERFSFYRESQRDFSRFKSLYFDVPGRSLTQNLLLKGKSLNPDQQITGRHFIEWALSFWPKEGQPFLLEKITKIFQNFPLEESLKASSWLSWLESEALILEIELEGENEGGISCLSFNALHSSLSPYVFVLGLDEESFKSLGPLNETEQEAVLNDLGFPLPFSHPKEKENSFLWFLQSSHYKELYLSLSRYDWTGHIKTDSLIYFMSDFLLPVEKKEISESLLWSTNKKQAHLDKILKSTSLKKETRQALKSALENKPRDFFHKQSLKLSPHSLKTYNDCPFKYAAKKLFFIPERDIVEREFSNLAKGSLVHKLLELFLKEYPNLLANEEQKNQIIQSLKPLKEKLIHKKQWLIVEDYLKERLESFIQKEKESRGFFPSLKPMGFEIECSSYWDQKKGALSWQGDYPFSGWIDRVDKDSETGTYVIRDYKPKSSGLSHISLKEGQEEFQLIFYAQALEQGLIKNWPPGRVSALFYSFYSENFLAKGFAEKKSLFENILGERSRGKKERELLEKAILNSNKKAQSIVADMEKGRFSPQPKTKKLCETCPCRTWCRVENFK